MILHATVVGIYSDLYSEDPVVLVVVVGVTILTVHIILDKVHKDLLITLRLKDPQITAPLHQIAQVVRHFF